MEGGREGRMLKSARENESYRNLEGFCFGFFNGHILYK